MGLLLWLINVCFVFFSYSSIKHFVERKTETPKTFIIG